MSYARVAVNIPTISGVYDYQIPQELAGLVRPGHLVTVPFGSQLAQAVVVDLVDSPAVADPKPIVNLIDPAQVLTAPQLAFARQLAESTLNPLSAIIGLFLPPGLAQHADTIYTLDPRRLQSGGDSPVSGVMAERLLALLKERSPLRGRQIDRAMPRGDWRKAMTQLTKIGLVKPQPVLPPPAVRPKFVRMAQLAVTPQYAMLAMRTLGKTPETLERRQKALQFLVREPDAVNVSWVYAESGCNLADLEVLEEMGFVRLFESQVWRDPVQGLEQIPDTGEITLTESQEAAINEIVQMLNKPATPEPFLLHGVTGSGKTEIYLRAAAEVIKRGKQAIILVPEIALTPQIVRRFLARFPGQVGLVHSKLSEGERYDTWRRARLGLLKVIIGPRSALFTPLPSVGLVVVDECHESSYYQSDPPFYHAVSAAQLYARLSGAVCLMGSATPLVETRYKTQGGSIKLLELPQRVTGLGSESGLPPVSIIDMREELKTGNRGIFSRALAESLAETLERGEQAILFLNRRGTATYVFCRDCGYIAKCPRCDTPLTFHTEGRGELRCHRCGYDRLMPQTCPQCKGKQIRAFGLGSEKVESEVTALLPQARVLRWDWETTRQKDAHEMILTHFANHQADVLVGTQMLAKGLDLPLVTLVGIVLADVGLTLPDPFAGERAFQLLTQVAGRAGRSSRGGKVILQTFMPENPIIQAAAGHDYGAFYERELAARRELEYPPFSRLARLEYRHADPAKAEAEARKVGQRLQERVKAENRVQTTVSVVPCFFEKMDNFYRWQVVIRSPNVIALLKEFRMEGWRVEVEPVSLL